MLFILAIAPTMPALIHIDLMAHARDVVANHDESTSEDDRKEKYQRAQERAKNRLKEWHGLLNWYYVYMLYFVSSYMNAADLMQGVYEHLFETSPDHSNDNRMHIYFMPACDDSNPNNDNNHTGSRGVIRFDVTEGEELKRLHRGFIDSSNHVELNISVSVVFEELKIAPSSWEDKGGVGIFGDACFGIKLPDNNKNEARFHGTLNGTLKISDDKKIVTAKIDLSGVITYKSDTLKDGKWIASNCHIDSLEISMAPIKRADDYYLEGTCKCNAHFSLVPLGPPLFVYLPDFARATLEGWDSDDHTVNIRGLLPEIFQKLNDVRIFIGTLYRDLKDLDVHKAVYDGLH